MYVNVAITSPSQEIEGQRYPRNKKIVYFCRVIGTPEPKLTLIKFPKAFKD